MSELLTPAEIINLTGAKRGYKQCETLAASGIKFVPRCDGKPAVTWTAVNTALSAHGADIATNNGFNLKAIQ